ncbi:hypothetical protein R1flu_010236 [Riccia fluitans]|uniref:BHLH domain-containing protein n=1 Tax=Riccia fluitans TaxID=41844 RepID=A0ABD1Z6X3_9MARC
MTLCDGNYGFSPFEKKVEDKAVATDEENPENLSYGGCSPQSSLLDSRGAFLGFEAMLGCPNEAGSVADIDNLSCSQLTCHLRLFDEENGEEGCCQEVVSRKRGFRELEQEEEEVESAQFSKRQRSQEELDDEVEDIICVGTCSCSRSISVADGFSGESLNPSHARESFNEGEEDEYEEELDESELELQMLCDDFCFEMPQEELHQYICCSKEEEDDEEDAAGEEADALSSGSARKCRRAKIKQTVKLLRELIPGGNCLDSGKVLDEAINYVKLLQLQVQTLVSQRRVFCPVR